MNELKHNDKRCNSIAVVQCFRFKIYITMGENYAKDDWKDDSNGCRVT